MSKPIIIYTKINTKYQIYPFRSNGSNKKRVKKFQNKKQILRIQETPIWEYFYNPIPKFYPHLGNKQLLHLTSHHSPSRLGLSFRVALDLSAHACLSRSCPHSSENRDWFCCSRSLLPFSSTPNPSRLILLVPISKIQSSPPLFLYIQTYKKFLPMMHKDSTSIVDVWSSIRFDAWLWLCSELDLKNNGLWFGQVSDGLEWLQSGWGVTQPCWWRILGLVADWFLFLFYFLLFYFNTMEEVHKLKFLSRVCSSEFCYFYHNFSYCILLSNCNLIGMVFYFFKFHLIICLVM